MLSQRQFSESVRLFENTVKYEKQDFSNKSVLPRNLLQNKDIDQQSQFSESGYSSCFNPRTTSTLTVNTVAHNVNKKSSICDTISVYSTTPSAFGDVEVSSKLVTPKISEPSGLIQSERKLCTNVFAEKRPKQIIESSYTPNGLSANYHDHRTEIQDRRWQSAPMQTREYSANHGKPAFGPESYFDRSTQLLRDLPNKQTVQEREADRQLESKEMRQEGLSYRRFVSDRVPTEEETNKANAILDEWEQDEIEKLEKAGKKRSRQLSAIINHRREVQRGKIPREVGTQMNMNLFKERERLEEENRKSAADAAAAQKLEMKKTKQARKEKAAGESQPLEQRKSNFGWTVSKLFGGGTKTDESNNLQNDAGSSLQPNTQVELGPMFPLDKKDIFYTQSMKERMSSDGVFHFLNKIVGDFNVGKSDDKSVVLLHPNFVNHFLNLEARNRELIGNRMEPITVEQLKHLYIAHNSQSGEINRAIVPVHRSEHFVLLHIGRYAKNKVHVHVMDSLLGSYVSDSEARRIAEQLFNVKKEKVTVTNATKKLIPRQTGDVECGVHTIQNAEACLRDETFNPDIKRLSVTRKAETIESARERIAKELKKILESRSESENMVATEMSANLISDVARTVSESNPLSKPDNEIEENRAVVLPHQEEAKSSCTRTCNQDYQERPEEDRVSETREVKNCTDTIPEIATSKIFVPENTRMTRSGTSFGEMKSRKRETRKRCNIKDITPIKTKLKSIPEVPMDVPEIDILDVATTDFDVSMDYTSLADASDTFIDVPKQVSLALQENISDDSLEIAEAPCLSDVPMEVANASVNILDVPMEQDEPCWNWLFDEDLDSIRISKEELTNQAVFMLMHRAVDANNALEGKDHVALVHVDYSHKLVIHWNDPKKEDPNISEYVYFDMRGTKKFIIPLIRGHHFTVLFLDKTSQSIHYMDSTLGFQFTDKEIGVIARELGVLNPKILKIGEYGKAEKLPQTVVQSERNSCGIFSVLYCELLCSSGTCWALKELNVAKKRREMLSNIMEYIELGKAKHRPLTRQIQNTNNTEAIHQSHASISDDFDFEPSTDNGTDKLKVELDDSHSLSTRKSKRSRKGRFSKVGSKLYQERANNIKSSNKQRGTSVMEEIKGLEKHDEPNTIVNRVIAGINEALQCVKDRPTLKALKRAKGCFESCNLNSSPCSTPPSSSEEYEPPAVQHSGKWLSPAKKKTLVSRYRNGWSLESLIRSYGLSKDEAYAKLQLSRLCKEVEENKLNRQYSHYLLKKRTCTMINLMDEVEMEEIHEMDIQRTGIEQSRVFGLNNFQGSRKWIQGVKDELGLTSRHIDKRITSPLTTPGPTVEEKVRKFKRDQVERIKRKYPPSKIFNVDQTGVKYENCRNRTLTKRGSRFVARTAQRLNALTHSFTVNPCISATGKLVGRTFVTLREQRAPRSFRNMVAPFSRRLQVTQTKSGMMTKRLAIKWFLKCFLPKIPDGSLLFLDSWNGFKDMMKLSAARRKNLEFVVIPPKTTSHLQPLDLVFNRQFKSFLKTLEGLIRSREKHLIIAVRAIRLKIIQFTMNQFKAKRFRGMIQKGFEELGVIGTYKPYVTPTKYCLHPKQTAGHGCQTNGCHRGSLVKCGYCDKLMCITHALEHLHRRR